MKTKLKHILFLAAISFSAVACGGSVAKPVSGFDVSMLSPSVLTVTPTESDDEDSSQESTFSVDSETAKQSATAKD